MLRDAVFTVDLALSRAPAGARTDKSHLCDWNSPVLSRTTSRWNPPRLPGAVQGRTQRTRVSQQRPGLAITHLNEPAVRDLFRLRVERKTGIGLVQDVWNYVKCL